MAMKKVGILTHYYGSLNFGGNLQAYALSQYINSLDGYSAEQISYDLDNLTKDRCSTYKESQKYETKIHHNLKQLLTHPLKYFRIVKSKFKRLFTKQGMVIFLFDDRNRMNFYKRDNCLLNFNNYIIRHSDAVYTEENIHETNSKYDIFITGSDQVWSGVNEVFMLDFVEDSKVKISYAASIARNSISELHSAKLKSSLKHYKAISVRSKTDYEIVSQLTDKLVDIVLDPVFLLSCDEWNMIISKNGKYVDEKYVFCYMLGDDAKVKRSIARFAKTHRYKIILIPHYKDNENGVLWNDIFLNAVKVYDISPAEFIGLIKNAEYVFTDSFHATAFSILYGVQFFCFERKCKWGNMNSRLIDLLNDFNCIDHYFSDFNKNDMYCYDDIKPINYASTNRIIDEYINKAKQFIIDNL